MKSLQYEAWIEDQYHPSMVVFSLLIIIFHPFFYVVLQYLPGLPPESLANRLVAVGVAVCILLIIWLVPRAKYRSSQLQIINASVAIFVTHIAVFNSGNHPMYLAASLTAIYGAQLSFVRSREWLVTMALVWLGYLIVSVQRGDYSESMGYVALLFYVANYSIATALVLIRGKIQYRELESRLALQQTNAELRQVTEQLQSELALARDMQQSLLPPASPRWPRLDVVCYSQPAREVGGDFYSYYRFSDDQIALAVGDVSGKGVPAALLMATSLSLLNEHIAQHEQPDLLLANLDRSLAPYTQLRRQNCALSYIEINKNMLHAVNAGGVPPYVRHTDGRVEEIEVGGFALGHGLGAENGYEMRSYRLEAGDIVLLVSDGVIEAKDRQNSLFSFARVEQVLADGPASSAQAMLQHIIAHIQRFVDSLEPHDDLTIVVLRVQ